MKNRFRKSETVDIAGFELPAYKSLLAGERFHLLAVNKDIFSGVKGLLDLAAELGDKLKVDSSEAWVILQSQGIATDGTDHRALILPYLARLTRLNDNEAKETRYMRAAVEMLLASRLDGTWLVKARPELVDAFPLTLTAAECTEFAKVAASDRLDSTAVLRVAKLIADALPGDIFDELFEFAQTEENKGVPLPTEDEPANDEVEDKDPKASSPE